MHPATCEESHEQTTTNKILMRAAFLVSSSQMPAPSDLDLRSSAGERLDVSAFYVSFAATPAEPEAVTR